MMATSLRSFPRFSVLSFIIFDLVILGQDARFSEKQSLVSIYKISGGDKWLRLCNDPRNYSFFSGSNPQKTAKQQNVKWRMQKWLQPKKASSICPGKRGQAL